MKNKVILGVIVIIGLIGMIFSFQLLHPDTDELFELRNMQGLKIVDTVKRNTMYGDHTSFPGEFLIHAPMMSVLDMFKHPRNMAYEQGSVDVSKKEFWILAIPKILCALLALYLFYELALEYLGTLFGQVVAFSIFIFNTWLVYYSFSLRPYGILPELAIFNLWLSTRFGRNLEWLHCVVIFFTCINHAYGPLMAFLPLIAYRHKRPAYFWAVCLLSLVAWAYYATYSNFGMVSNSVQSHIDPFGYIIPNKFLQIILESLFSPAILTAFAMPFVALGITQIKLQQFWFLIFMVILPITLIVCIDVKTNYIIYPRQYIWVLPALGLWCGMMAENGINILSSGALRRG